MHDTVESVLNKHVRPLLRAHGGDIEVLEVSAGIVRFKFLGKCSGCPAADLTTEELVQAELTQRLPDIHKAVLVQNISDELLSQARDILRQHREG